MNCDQELFACCPDCTAKLCVFHIGNFEGTSRSFCVQHQSTIEFGIVWLSRVCCGAQGAAAPQEVDQTMLKDDGVDVELPMDVADVVLEVETLDISGYAEKDSIVAIKKCHATRRKGKHPVDAMKDWEMFWGIALLVQIGIFDFARQAEACFREMKVWRQKMTFALKFLASVEGNTRVKLLFDLTRGRYGCGKVDISQKDDIRKHVEQCVRLAIPLSEVHVEACLLKFMLKIVVWKDAALLSWQVCLACVASS